MSSFHRDISRNGSQQNVLLLLTIIVGLAIAIAIALNKALELSWPLSVMLLLSPLLVLFVFMRPLWGIALIFVFSYMDALQRLGSSSVSAIKLVLVLTFVTWVLMTLMKKADRPKTPFDIPLLAFGIAMFATLFFGHIEDVTAFRFHFRTLAATISFIVIVFISGSFIKDEKTLHTLLLILIVCATLTALLGLLQFISNDQLIKVVYPENVHESVGAGHEGGLVAKFKGRTTGTTVNANGFAFRITIILPLALAYIYSLKKKKSAIASFFLTAAVYIMSLGVILSQSRSNYVAMTLTFFVMFLYTPRKNKVGYSIFFFLLPAVIAGVMIIHFGVYDRTPISEDASISSRLYDFVLMKDIYLDNPSLILTGTGYGGYSEYAIMYMNNYGLTRIPVLHNDFTRLLMEFGIIPFVAYIVLWITMISSLFRLNRIVPPDKKYFIAAFAMTFVSIFIHSMVHTALFIPFIWLILVMLVATNTIYTEKYARSLQESH